MTQPVLPPWASTLRDRYLAGESSLFLISGNVRDLQPWTDAGGKTEWLDLRAFLERFLSRTRDIVAYYNVSQGLHFGSAEQEKRFRRSVDTRRMLDGDKPLGDLPRTVTEVLPLVEGLVTDGTQSSGIILDYLEMVAPEADPAFMTSDDKANLVTLRRWSTEPALLSTDNLILMVTERIGDISKRLVASPQLVTLQIPFPDEAARGAFLKVQLTEGILTEMPLDVLAKVTAGLSLVQIRSLLQMAHQSGKPLTFNLVNARKKSIIEQECQGLVEFVAPEHNLSHVGGMENIKADLLRVAESIRAGQTRRVPMGMIFVGPMGTGKTFVAEAFAAESGLTCLKFKNFRDRWVGSTEANLEKVLELVNALGYVLLIIDEAERALSAGDSDGGVGSRVIARLKEFMSDTDHRGRVLMLMMTNRPDKLDTDLKRPGRFDVKIPFFFPESADERRKVLDALFRRNKVTLAPDVSLDPVAAATQGYSAAELEAVALAALGRMAEANQEQLTQDALDGATADVIPSRDTQMLAYMEMLAVFECSARRMLPDRFRDISTDDVHARLEVLRNTLGRRAQI
jgi:transitional endoplasmic reticulum ATPase